MVLLVLSSKSEVLDCDTGQNPDLALGARAGEEGCLSCLEAAPPRQTAREAAETSLRVGARARESQGPRDKSPGGSTARPEPQCPVPGRPTAVPSARAYCPVVFLKV